jgi:hypothetical protein
MFEVYTIGPGGLLAIIGISEDGKEHVLYKVDKEINDGQGWKWRAYPLVNVAFALQTFKLVFGGGSWCPNIRGVRVTGLETHPLR